jgi:hypothetical protein
MLLAQQRRVDEIQHLFEFVLCILGHIWKVHMRLGRSQQSENIRSSLGLIDASRFFQGALLQEERPLREMYCMEFGQGYCEI